MAARLNDSATVRHCQLEVPEACGPLSLRRSEMSIVPAALDQCKLRQERNVNRVSIHIPLLTELVES